MRNQGIACYVISKHNLIIQIHAILLMSVNEENGSK